MFRVVSRRQPGLRGDFEETFDERLSCRQARCPVLVALSSARKKTEANLELCTVAASEWSDKLITVN